ncbi:MAG: putative NRPS-like protein biosynthetic cluster [Bathelium mastoideum]|nr:MAG: putative NRPS-like protein biosynthetic cluster [Bathelium mastoideum]
MAASQPDVKSQRAAAFQNPSSTLVDLLWASNVEPCIHDPSTGRSLSHESLFQCVRDFRLDIPSNVSSKPVVAIVLPNGPLLAVTVIAVANRYTAAPISSSSGADQIRADVLQAGSNVVLALPQDIPRLGLCDSWVANAGIDVVPIEFGDDMVVRLMLQQSPGPFLQTRHSPNVGSDCAILLFTSGTSGKKKLVPLTVRSILNGVAFVIDSWGLTPADVCNNLMPLHHVGGLVRNLFAPVMSGGSTICCKAFDPNLFWDVVEDLQPTWYYASPTMHSMILDEAANRVTALSKSRIRLVCNAAGGLLPSLACQLRDTFQCVVLPSYGMTECMPISSPPLDYQLDRPGTSGISVGPQLTIFDGNDNHCKPGDVGRIMVRGEPVFPGYLKPDGSIDTTPFTKDGWFDTGDMGYMDEDGYLYVTGRNKEVINRGGELISPFEVEEAIVLAAQKPESPIFGRVSQALAFSVTHDVLQEVVGIVLVTPEGSPRTDIRALQEAVSSSLQQVKWPVLLVFMDNVPKRNNKVLRIKLGERLGFKEITDALPMAERHFEAACPPPDTALSVSIECTRCPSDHSSLMETLAPSVSEDTLVHLRSDANSGFPEMIIAPKDSKAPVIVPTSFAEKLLADLRSKVHGYHIPSKVHCLDSPLPQDKKGRVDEDALDQLLTGSQDHMAKADPSMSETQQKIAYVFADVLSCSVADLSVTSDFFNLGGDSLRAGRLLSMLRKEFQIRLPIDVLFANGQIGGLAHVVDQKLSEAGTFVGSKEIPSPLPGCAKTYSSTNPLLLLLQLLPIILVYPGKRALTWTIFIYTLTATQNWVTTNAVPGRLLNLVFSLGVARLITRAVTPFLAIAFKWVVIGKYREGIYPMWGWYHTRWWLVQKILAIGGMGHFSISNYTRVLYYRLLGAKIGKGVGIAKGVTLGEYDLLNIGDNVTLDKCICRPFAAERNTSMYLGRIVIGRDSSIGQSSIVAAGTVLPESTCIGPNSSSWEMNDASESNRDLSSSKAPGGPWFLNAFITMPMMVFVRFVGALPWMLGLIGLVITQPQKSKDQLASVIYWFAAPHRIGFHYFALIMNTAFGPVFIFVLVLLLKFIVDRLIGKTKPGPASSRSQLQRFRMSFLKAIMPGTSFHKLTDLFGAHYNFTSFAARAMGAKVGSRVYWPGTGPSIQDFDLLDIGNDVVFGSRSHLMTSDGIGSDYVQIGDGAMVSDRVVLLPGSSLGSGTVMGSGALTRRSKHYPANTTWVGSKQGEAVCLSGTSRHDAPGHLSPSDLDKALLSQMTTPINSQLQSRVASTIDVAGTQSLTETEVASSISVAASVEDLSKTEKGEMKPAGVSIKEVQDSKPQPTSSSPFGRAFYEGKAPYRVMGPFPIFLYSAFTTIFTSFYWNVATTSAVQIVAKLIRTNSKVLLHVWYRPLTLYSFFLGVIAVLMSAQAIFALAVVIGAKWSLMGRRKAGSYDWDKSSYNQRWQVFLAIEKLRRHCYGGHGIIGMLTGTHWTVMYFRALGATIGKDCALFAGGLPSLMFTEPDLLTLGDRVSVDDASLVAHINTRGHFNLNPLSVGDRSVLRSGSRLLSGARMESDSCLLEHTLIMAGDVADSGATYQGWPADAFSGLRAPVQTVA